jgi:hypothetical protein
MDQSNRGIIIFVLIHQVTVNYILIKNIIVRVRMQFIDVILYPEHIINGRKQHRYFCF